MKTATLALTALLAIGACTSAQSAPPQTARRAEPNRILASEMVGAQQPNLYAYITMARPRWLESTRTTGFDGRTTTVTVFMNGQRYGDVGQLRSLPLDGVKELRYYGVSEAQQRFNTPNLSSVIDVVTK